MTVLDPKDITAGLLPDIETLETVAWRRADLTAQIRWARLQHEIVGISPEKIIDLAEQVEAFKGVCRALKGVFDDA